MPRKLTKLKEARQMIDDLGLTNEQRKLLKTREDSMKAVAKEIFGEGTHTGNEFAITIANTDYYEVDLEKLCLDYKISKKKLESYRRNNPRLVLTCARIAPALEIEPTIAQLKEKIRRKALNS